MKRRVHLQVVAIAFAATIVFSLIGVQSQNAPQATVAIDPDDIGGVVTSSKGPEAGVWVIAETRDTPTRLIKSVVTDDRGRYLIPDLPKGNYDVWVRGYGLVDSPKVKATPGKQLNLSAMVAPAPGAAALRAGEPAARKHNNRGGKPVRGTGKPREPAIEWRWAGTSGGLSRRSAVARGHAKRSRSSRQMQLRPGEGQESGRSDRRSEAHQRESSWK